MSVKNMSSKLKMTSYADLCCAGDGFIEVPLSDLYAFKNHPFKVLDDEKMDEMVESIKLNGILSPALVRTRKEGGYELISGHRRRHAAEIAGLETMPVIVKELTDDEATIIMVDSNIQREEILPSEKAFAFKMKLEALEHQEMLQGHHVPNVTMDEIGEENGVSGRQVRRYIRLTYLLPGLLELVDTKEISLVMGVEMSLLEKQVQEWIYEGILLGIKITPDQIKLIKNQVDNGDVSRELIMTIISSELRKRTSRNLTIKENKLLSYFPKDYSIKQMENVIYELLDLWKERGEGFGE